MEFLLRRSESSTGISAGHFFYPKLHVLVHSDTHFRTHNACVTVPFVLKDFLLEQLDE